MSESLTRTFVAVDIPEHIKTAISGIDLRGLAEGVDAQQLHVTINFLGYLNQKRFEHAAEIIKRYEHKQFEVSVEGGGIFESRGRGVVFVGIHKGAAELLDIHTQLKSLFEQRGILQEDRAFTPHITFARFKGLDRNKLGALGSIVEGVKARSFGNFRCSSLELKRSVLTGSGPVYSTLAASEFIS
ncbi:MAG: RNA 2',3'-cyclic phosphodiesterase [Candidatus Micrarchaeia archaeon]